MSEADTRVNCHQDTCRHSRIVRRFYSCQVKPRFHGGDGHIAMFEDWLLAIGFPETDAMALWKAAILRASLGITEGFRIYSSLATNPREAYVDAMARLETHFGRPKPVQSLIERSSLAVRQPWAAETGGQGRGHVPASF